MSLKRDNQRLLAMLMRSRVALANKRGESSVIVSVCPSVCPPVCLFVCPSARLRRLRHSRAEVSDIDHSPSLMLVALATALLGSVCVYVCE